MGSPGSLLKPEVIAIASPKGLECLTNVSFSPFSFNFSDSDTHSETSVDDVDHLELCRYPKAHLVFLCASRRRRRIALSPERSREIVPSPFLSPDSLVDVLAIFIAPTPPFFSNGQGF
jgi:hypothetical protein